MQELFSEKLKVKSQKLGNLASNIYSGGTPSRSKMEYYRGDIPWVKSTEIKFNRIKKTEESITELGLKNSSAKLCPKGSVLVAMYGQGVTRGKSAILDIDATTNQAIAIIEVGKNLNNLFLFYFLQHSYDALRNVGHGSNQSNLNLNIIKNFDIPKIKYKEQEQIAEIILSVDSKIEVNKQIKNKLIQLKKGLMNDLLSGEVRVS
jgi:type I restriction enzyme S subunit